MSTTEPSAVILPALIGAAGALLVFFLRELSERNRKRTELLRDKLELLCNGLAEVQNNLVTVEVVPVSIWTSQANKLAGEIYRLEGLVILHFPTLESDFRELEDLVHRHRGIMFEVGDKLAPYFQHEDEAWDIYITQARPDLEGSTKRVGDKLRKIRNRISEEKNDLTNENGIYY